MGSIIDRALDIINDHLKDQTSSFQVASPLSAGRAMAQGGHVLEDDYPSHYLPGVGRQVMADGGAPIKGFEGRVSSPVPVDEPVAAEGVEAYHGSPHEFEEFDPSKIGTGEGAQVYGHGLYFAGNENIAKYYRDSLTDPDNVSLHFKGRPVDTVWNDEISDRWGDVVKKLPKDHEEDFQTVMGNLSQIKNLSELKHIRASLDRKQNNILDKVVLPELSKPEIGSGHMYEVRLDAHPEEHLLDWDKPLKDQHPNVIAAFNKAVVPIKDDEDKMIHEMYADKAAHEYLGLFDKSKGSQAYKTFAEHLGGQDKASEALSKAGIRGIRYLDAGSRGQDEKSGSHNYVIFDPQHIKVKRRYAEGGEIPKSDDEGIVAYAFGNSVPHLDKRYEEEASRESQLAKGVEPVGAIPERSHGSSIHDRVERSYGGGIDPIELRYDNLEDQARRLILWSYAAAPLGRPLARAEGGATNDPVDKAANIVGASAPADTQNAVDIARNLTPMGFYSAAAEAASKFPQKAPIDQIISKIKGQPNVKTAELDNANLKDEFAGQRSVDPQEVARHLQANVPNIKERVYGGKPAVEYKPKALLERPEGFEDADDVYEVGPYGKPPHLISVKTNYESVMPHKYSVYGPSGFHSTYFTLADAVAHANNSINNIEQPLYKEYTIPGGENYREVVMALPQQGGTKAQFRVTGALPDVFDSREEAETYIQQLRQKAERNPNIATKLDRFPMNIVEENKPVSEPYKSSHWLGIPNPLAHLRMSDRDNGKTLHLEELQSDWGQEGRKHGFYDPNRDKTDSTLTQMSRDVSSAVPSGPYVTDTNQWVDLGLKRALMEAAKGGYDKLIWTPGEEQAARYDLSKQIDRLVYNPNAEILMAYKDGKQIINQSAAKNELEGIVGKDVAKNLLASEGKTLPDAGSTKYHILEGQDLAVGGEGMKSFYDKLVPQRLSKLVAQYDKDAKVAPHSHSLKGENGEVKAHAIEITPKLRAAILKGLPAFMSGGDVGKSPIINRAFKVLSKLSR